MIKEYIDAALKEARYELIKNRNPYYGEISRLRGVWATGKTLEECRKNLEEVLEGWLIVRLQKGLSIPALDGKKIRKLKKLHI